MIWCHSSNFWLFWAGSALVYNSTIYMYLCDSMRAIIQSLSLSQIPIFMYKDFTSHYIIIVASLGIISCHIMISLLLALLPNFIPVSKEENIKHHNMMGCAHCPRCICQEILVILCVTVSDMSSSEVHNIATITWCKCSSMAFTCGFLILVGFWIRPHVLHRSWKWHLNSLPLSFMTTLGQGYLQNQKILVNLAICLLVLLSVSSISTFLPVLDFI